MRLTRQKLATAGVVAVLALTGCGSGGDEAIPATAIGSLEELASEANCRPDIQTDTDEIRQAICENGDGRFILAAFATDQGQREWLNLAQDYGGHYLVGARWVAVGDTKVVTVLHGRLGGIIEEGRSHHSGSSSGGGNDMDPGPDG
jgi:hypothetical protein